ncbi:hypothetical protein [Phytohabitans suffuscus]|uniref:hypothetical protein n=1 Tax=Phytohabitans suffuscus TaxID=624315 RepID=UPI001E4BAD73|nr:hypothetical protein [Phytohabitans suffuscus]
MRWRLGGLLAGIALAGFLVLVQPDRWLGLGIALAAPALAMCVVAGVLIGEVTAAAPQGTRRSAALEVRTLRSYLPRTLTWSAAVTVTGLAALLTATGLTGDADDLGRAGRVLTLTCGADGTQSTGPWPGTYYGAPIGAAVLAGLAGAGLAARTVVGRRRPDPAVRGADDLLRRASVRTIVASAGLLAATPLAGAAALTGHILVRSSCASPALHAIGWTATALAAVAGLGACGFAAEVLLPRRTATTPPRRSDAP